ncbi:MAG: pantoate kinase [Fervidicoccaceae archaeon]
MSLLRNSEKCVEVPHHITGFWRPIYTGDPLTTGSIGAGLIISPYTKACLHDTNEKLKVLINNSILEHTTLKTALEKLLERNKEIMGTILVNEPLPIGVGYATSSTITLSTLLALKEKLGLPSTSLAQIAHVAEVINKTGLGDVLSIYSGYGLTVRTKPGAPGIGEVISVRVPASISIITCALGVMSTQAMLTSYSAYLEKIGEEIFNKFIEEVELSNFLRLAKEFSTRIGFLNDELNKEITSICKNCLGFYAKKKVLTILVENAYTTEIVEKILKTKLCVMGVHVHYPVNTNKFTES